MIRSFFLVTLLLLSASCVQEEIASYDDLTLGEQTEIQNRSRDLCLSESSSDFSLFKTDSNANVASLTRGMYWKVVYTSGTNTSTNYIYVWKVDGSNVYLLYQQTIESATYHSFIKLTENFNGEMIDDLLVQKCDKTISLTQNESSYTVTFTDVASTEGTVNYKTSTTYSSTSSFPAFFGALNRDVTKKKLNDSNTVVSTETFSYKVSYVGSDTTTLNSAYTTYSNRKYCVHKYTNATPKTFTFPFDLNCKDTTTDQSNQSPGDATLDFAPDTELVI